MKTIKIIKDGQEVEATVLEEEDFETNDNPEDLEDTLVMKPILNEDKKESENCLKPVGFKSL